MGVGVGVGVGGVDWGVGGVCVSRGDDGGGHGVEL